MLLVELRQASRRLASARGFTFAAIVSLALGIGGNIAMFSLVNAALLKPLPYRDPEELVLIREVLPKFSHLWPSLPVKAAYVPVWRKRLRSFESIGAVLGRTMTLSGGEEPEKISAALMTGDFLGLLGIQPELGRWFLRSEEETAAPDVVILSDSLWRRRFSADPNVIGRMVVLNGKPAQVVGVTPARMPFYGIQLQVDLPERPDVFVPLRLTPSQLDLSFVESDTWAAVIGRLKPGIQLQQAEAELEVSM